MKYASEDLIHEHEAILFSLKVLEEMSRLVKGGFLFPAYEDAGVPRENGPIGVMLSEHTTGRTFIKQMSEAASGSSLSNDEFVNGADGYINLLRAHIEKENKVLFPMGDSKLTDAKQKELIRLFEEFEDNVIGKGKHEELHKQLAEFNRKYLK